MSIYDQDSPLASSESGMIAYFSKYRKPHLGATSIRICGIRLTFLFFLLTGVAVAETLEIPGTGASQLLVRELAKNFEVSNPDIEILVPHTIGSRGGIRALLSGKSDVARISRPLNEGEKAAGIKAIFFAISPIVFIAHPSVKGVNNITAEEIISIYSGELRNWGALDGPPRKIYPVTRDSGSVLKTVRTSIAGFPEAKLPLAKPVSSIIDMVKTVEAHPFSLGFSTLNLARSHEVVVLDFNGVKPTDTSVISGSYPISVSLGLAMRNPDLPHLQRFVDYLYGDEAAEIIRQHGAVPLPGS